MLQAILASAACIACQKLAAASPRSPSASWTSPSRASPAGNRPTSWRARRPRRASPARARQSAAWCASLGKDALAGSSQPAARASRSASIARLSLSFARASPTSSGLSTTSAACSTPARAASDSDEKLTSSRWAMACPPANASTLGGLPSRMLSIQVRSKSTATPARPADAVISWSRTAAGASTPALRRTSSAIASRDKGPSWMAAIPDPAVGRSQGSRSNSRPLGGLPATASASISSSGEPASARQRGRVEARCSRSATRQANLSRVSPAGSTSDDGLCCATVAAALATSSEHSPTSMSMASMACESVDRRASRSALPISACRPDPGDPATHTTQTVAAPCARRSM